MDRQKIIKNRWIRINRIFIILILFVIISLMIREYQTFKDSITYFNQSSFEYRSHEIEHEVDNRIEEINSVQDELLQNFRDELQEKVIEVDFFANRVVENSDESLTLEEKREIYIETIYQYDIQEDEYLFFAMDMDGYSYLSGLTKNLEGTDISYLQDAITQRYFVLDMIDVIENSEDGQGFIDYYWMKEVGGEHLKKTSFLYYNEEMELFIGTGIYEVDYIKSVQNELFGRISSYYSGTEDYIYVMGYDANVIFHPIDTFDKEALLDIKTIDGVSFHDYVLDELQDNEFTTFEYYFNVNGEVQRKTAYIRSVDDWDMYIGKSFVLDDLLLEQDEYFNSIIIDYIVFNVFTLFIIVGLVVVLKKLINNNFNDIQEEFSNKNKYIKEMSFRDSLTGLYNRKYFDTYLDSIKNQIENVTVIMIDANGLKLINDTFGHEKGDELLIQIATISQNVFDKGVHFRWGGDEFVIVDYCTDEESLKETISLFHKECRKIEIQNFTLSASLGYVIGSIKENDVYAMLNQAEIMMYNNKMHESLSTKRQVIDNILNTLYNNFSFEEQHSENVKKYALRLGSELKLDKEDMNKLRLASLMHDVGKIAVADDILTKREKLSAIEIDEIKKHPEKGYRILSAYPELSEYGNYALTHHERYDGQGYPRGIKGEEIPLFSRIISIADAFDAMTSDRVYKVAISKEDALIELNKNKGTQFDPKLIDIFTRIMSQKAKVSKKVVTKKKAL